MNVGRSWVTWTLSKPRLLKAFAQSPMRWRTPRQATCRFSQIARRELGCGPSDLASVSENILVEDAKNIIRANLAHAGVVQGPHAGLRFVASPVWVLGNEGNAVREASLIPAGFVDYYFGGRLASSDVTDAVSRLAAQCVVRNATQPWTISFLTRGAREMYAGSGVASATVAGMSYRPWHFCSVRSSPRPPDTCRRVQPLKSFAMPSGSTAAEQNFRRLSKPRLRASNHGRSPSTRPVLGSACSDRPDVTPPTSRPPRTPR